MNFLDIILIILNIIILISAIVINGLIIKAGIDDVEIGLAIGETILLWITVVIIMLLTFGIPFVVLDKASGSTIGTITSVDKNFFGTTGVYVKTSETTQEKYCIEDETISKQASELIGSKVKISYGQRVGLYSTGKCKQAPLTSIKIVE